MENNTLIDMIAKQGLKDTESLLSELIPFMNAESLDSFLVGRTKEEKQVVYNKMRVYKSRLLKGERKQKTLNEVFSFFGYNPVTTVWQKSTTNE